MVCNDTETFLCSNVKGRKQMEHGAGQHGGSQVYSRNGRSRDSGEGGLFDKQGGKTGFSHEKEINKSDSTSHNQM